MACQKCGYNKTPENKWPSWSSPSYSFKEGRHCPICYTPIYNKKMKKKESEISEFGENLLSALRSKEDNSFMKANSNVKIIRRRI